MVALESKTLREKDYFSAPSAFTTRPITFALSGKEIVAAGNRDGRIYLLDAASLGGSDHKTPLAFSAAANPSNQTITGLATFEANGTRWVVVAATFARPSPTPKDFVAGMPVSEQNGKVSVGTGWIAPQVSPQLTPAIANGVVFGLSAGEPTGNGNAVLYALDATTGKELWNSGTTITSRASGIGPAVDDGQVYVVTADGTLWTFGFVVER
jgi:outer membrane protein assembly factor BamB